MYKFDLWIFNIFSTDLGYQHIYTPVKPIVLAHQNCFGYETNVKTLLNPTIFSNYGLTYRDFYIVNISINHHLLRIKNNYNFESR